MKNLIIGILSMSFILFIIGGFLIVSESALVIVEIVWIVTLASLALAAITGALGGVVWLWNKAGNEALIYPDENGNYPLKLGRKGANNLNLPTPQDNQQAWGLWQLTNNRNGSPPREIIKGMGTPAQPVSLPPIISLESEAPPILIEAKTIARDM